MNKVILMGRLTRDPEMRYTQESLAIARFTLAVDRRHKTDGEQNADFINCKAFGKNGEFVQKYLHKGTKIVLEGHWQTGSYTNKDGGKVYTNECVIEGMDFAESKKESTESQPQTDADGFMNVPDDIDEQLPFN